MAIRIITDSASCLSNNDLNNVKVVPLNIIIDSKEYKDQIEITNEEFYKKLVTVKGFPKTSQPSPQMFLNHYEDAKKHNDDVIVICLSSALSGTMQSAKLATEMIDYPRIHIIESYNVIQGLKIIVTHANDLINQGKSVKEIIEAVEALKGRIKIIAIVDTLEYLYKGGRLKKGSYVFGNIIGVKPLLTVTKDGKVEPFAKCIGINRALKELLDKTSVEQIDKNYPIYYIYTTWSDNVEKLQTKIHTKDDTFTEFVETISAVVGAHIGPNGFGMIYVTKEV